MITSDRQLKVTLEKIDALKKALAAGPDKGVPEDLRDVFVDGHLSMIESLNKEVSEYEHLKTIKPSEIEVRSFADLRLLPIRYRIAAHLTQNEFANKMNINLRQICRYEDESYENLTVETLQGIIEKLPVQISGFVKG